MDGHIKPSCGSGPGSDYAGRPADCGPGVRPRWRASAAADGCPLAGHGGSSVLRVRKVSLGDP